MNPSVLPACPVINIKNLYRSDHWPYDMLPKLILIETIQHGFNLNYFLPNFVLTHNQPPLKTILRD